MTVGTEYVVMYSSGAGSWAAARRLRDTQPDARLTLLFADTRTEDEDNYRFLRESAADLDAPLVVVADGRDVWQVFNDQRMIGNTRISNCSRTLKQRPARVWLDANADPADVTVVVGIDWTEAHRLTATTREELLRQAYDQHRDHRQYDGRWDAWVVGRIARTLRTKAGLAFERGDLVLLDPTRIETVRGRAYRTAYSWRNQCNTSIPAMHVVDAAQA